MKTLRSLTGMVVCLSLAGAGSARADAVTDWNAITVTAVGIGRPGPVGNLDIALVHAAVHDAVQAIDGRFEPYHVRIPEPPAPAAAVAVAAALRHAHGHVPTQRALDATYSDYVTSHGLGGDPGLGGGPCGRRRYAPPAARTAQPASPADTGGTDPGQWRPTDSLLIGPGRSGLPGPPFGPPAPFSPGAIP